MQKLLALLVMAALSSYAGAATIPVTGWLVHNGTSTVGGTAANPTFTAGDNITVMAPFSDISLANNGDYVEASTTLTMSSRTSLTGVNALNTQLRFGLYDDRDLTLTAGDATNVGIEIDYTNTAAGGSIREQPNSPAQGNPFTSPTTFGNGTQDSGADSIQGANPGDVTFTLRLTRDGSNFDLTGSISGTDSVSGNPYLATYSVANYIPAATPFTFNRVGLFLGDNVNATRASLANSTITTNVPEPASLALAAGMVMGIMARRRKR